ncbi:MAG: PD40 domain-containing protein, partial [Anaerolineales bacterium]|nr:PD40 domain-containing protein [Anaerolineales bacterium]
TDMTTWPWYRSDALGVAIQHLPGWQLSTEENGVVLMDAPTNAAATAFVTLAAYPNPDDLPLPELLAAVWGGAAADFALRPVQSGPHAAHLTADLPFAGGALTALLPADGRFLAVSLSPYSLANPTPAQAFHEQIFHGMLATLQLLPPGQPTPAPPPGLGRGNSRSPVISADGRFVAFLSDGPLTANAPGGVANVFIRDTNLGQTELISRDVDGRALTIPVYGMTMSANAQVVAYYSFAGNIVLGDELDCGSAEQPISCEDLFIVDRLAGTTERVPLGRPQGLGADHTLALSADGRFVAYGHAGNLWLYDRGTQTAEPLLAGVNGGGANDAIFAPRFAADGRTLAFVTRASNLLVNDANATYDVFVLELDSGQIQRVSVATDGTEADNRSGVHSFVETFDGAVDISANGRFVAFSSAAANLSAEATAACPDYRGPDRPCLNLYLHDRVTGETRLITRQSNGDSYVPALSADGRFVAFTSNATTLSPYAISCQGGSLIGCPAVYLYDQELGTNTLLSIGPNMAVANAPSGDAGLSADGRYLVFASPADNLVPGDANETWDIFRLDRETGDLTLISLANP